MKKILTIFTILMIMLSFGCMNEKTVADKGVDVSLQRVGNQVSVVLNETSDGGVYSIRGKIEEDDIAVTSENVHFVYKEESKIYVVLASKGESNKKGEVIFTIESEENVTVQLEESGELENINIKGKRAENILLGDINQDGVVSILDLSSFSKAYGTEIGNKSYNQISDIYPSEKGSGDWSQIYSIANSDGKIDLKDFIVFAKNFGKEKPNEPEVLLITADKTTVKEGDKVNFTAKMGAENVTVVWSVDETILDIDGTLGLALKEGTTKVTATANGVTSNELTITVEKVEVTVTNITISGVSTLEEEKKSTYSAEVTYSDGTKDSEVIWSVSSESVATINPSTGELTAISEGVVTVTAMKLFEKETMSVTITKKITPEEGIVIYLHESYGNQLYAWAGESESLLGAWPGTKLTNKKGSYLYYSFDTTIAEVNFLVLKDGAKITAEDQLTNKTVWYKEDGSTTNENPEGPQKPEVKVDSIGGYFATDKTVTVTITSDIDVTSKKYTLNGTEHNLTGTTINFGSDMNDGDQATLSISATNEIGTTIIGPYTYTKGESQIEKIAFATPEKLGAEHSTTQTTFTIYSPDSSNVTLTLDGTEYTMDKVSDFNGYRDIYGATISGNLHLYEYQIKINGKTVRDPYGKMIKHDVNLADGQGPEYTENGATITSNTGSQVNIVMDMDKSAILWSPRPAMIEREDAVIYEINIRDYTISGNSGVSANKKGKYMGMVETGTTYNSVATGIDHLKELGVTHVQIMPFYDFSNKKNHSTGQLYNWGYDPVNYNVPEERFSSNPADYEQRIKETKMMIDEFHKNGIRVIMDVVYNHTFWDEMFMDITSKYYIYHNGVKANASGCGNGLDTDNPMVSRFIRDSLEYWLEEYNLDGFRFDLMAIYKAHEVNQWGEYLNARFSDRNILMYGEPWTGMWQDDPDGRAWAANRPVMSSGHIGAFNGGYRESIKGGNDDDSTAFMFNWQGNVKGGTSIYNFKIGMKGGVMDYEGNSRVGSGDWWMYDYHSANDPEQSINYISAHDNYCLWDKIEHTLSGADHDYKVAVNNFGTAIVMTSQGIPFIHSGDEFLRTKFKGDFAEEAHNSYMWGDGVNEIDWQKKVDNQHVVNYFTDLIKLRKEHPGFRMNTLNEVNENVFMSDSNGVVTQYIKAGNNGDSWNEIKVIYNPGSSYTEDTSGGWTKVFDGGGFTDGGDGNCSGTTMTVFKK